MGLFSRRRTNVADLTRRRDLAGLIEAAGAVDATTRNAAIAGLAEIGPGDALPAAIEALEDGSDQARCAAVHCLYEAAEAMPLAEAISWLPPSSSSRALALAAIAELDEPEAAPVLGCSLVYGDAQGGLREDEVELVLRLCRSARDSTARDEVVDVLTEAVENDHDEVAGRAEDLLLSLGEDAAPALIALAESSPAPVRAVRVLGQIGGPSVLEPLIRAVEHADPRTREEACAALGALRDPVSADALLRAMRDPDHGVRVQAAAALDRIGTAAIAASISAVVSHQVENAKPRPRSQRAAHGPGRARR
jgi:HEAT repeat protein